MYKTIKSGDMFGYKVEKNGKWYGNYIKMNELKKYGDDYTHIDKVWVVDEITYITKTRFNITFTEMYSLDDKLIGYLTYNDEE